MLKSNGFTKPRSELLRSSVPFLKQALEKRWFPTEQTIHLIFQCLWSRNQFQAMPILFPKINDDGKDREQPEVIQQVERMEVWLKYMWRDRQKELERDWCKTREFTENVASLLLHGVYYDEEGFESPHNVKQLSDKTVMVEFFDPEDTFILDIERRNDEDQS